MASIKKLEMELGAFPGAHPTFPPLQMTLVTTVNSATALVLKTQIWSNVTDDIRKQFKHH